MKRPEPMDVALISAVVALLILFYKIKSAAA